MQHMILGIDLKVVAPYESGHQSWKKRTKDALGEFDDAVQPATTTTNQTKERVMSQSFVCEVDQ